MITYSFINKEFLGVDKSTREICFIRFDSGTVNLFGKIIYLDQLEFDNVLDLMKKFDSEVKNFLSKNEYNPLYNHNPVNYSKYRDKKKAIKIILTGLDIVNKFTESVYKNPATIKFIDGDPDYFFKRWSSRLISTKRIFKTL